tara:strand:- start:177 stop:1343 length:1167 start_codon:yes stop_codon:yes gene_type:complete
MTSTIKADVVTAQTTNGNVTLQGNGTGTVAIGDNTAITGTATVSSTLGVTGATTLSGQAYPTAGGLWSGRNMVINGSQAVSQRGTSTTSVTSSAYFTDRWQLNFSGTIGAATVTQATDSDLPGFPKNLKIDVTTADASLAAGDRLLLRYAMEGQDAQRMKKGTASAEKVTLSFWVKATKTGTNVVEFFDNDNSRHTNAQYTVSSSDTWEHKTITFPADTTGTLGDDNNSSIFIFFGIACGTTWTSGSIQSSWASSVAANRFPGQVNNFDSTSNNFQITGVQLECGEAATPFEFESYGETLQKCKRYYQVVQAMNRSPMSTGSQYNMVTFNVIEMRSVPSNTLTAGSRSNVTGTPTISFANGVSGYHQMQGSAAGGYAFNEVIKLDAEL